MKPMLATATQVLPTGPEWGFEFKWDGVRALADVTERGVRLASRTEGDITAAYPELVAVLDGVGDALLDGEVVAFLDGRPSFEALQTRMHVRSASDARALARDTPVTFVVFDMLRRHGVELEARPYSERRATLERWLAHDADSLRGLTLSPMFDDGAATETAARAHRLEGVMAKRLASPYRPGLRSPDWRKLRFLRTGDFVVIGWESPASGSQALSSALLAYRRDGMLHYAGKVGSGISGAMAHALEAQLEKMPECPLANVPAPTSGRRVTWVRPAVVLEVQFLEWTSDHRLRHPVFGRIRDDKTAEEATGDE
jgi:bifunctional non-homologous end joining protein LigD